jgi:hypothetical protein
MVQHKQSYHIDQSVNKTSSKIDSIYPGCPLNAITTDVFGFGFKPCLLLSDDPKVRAAARQKTAGEQLAEQGEYLEGGLE